MKGGTMLVTADERAAVEKGFVAAMDAWRKRRGIFRSIWWVARPPRVFACIKLGLPPALLVVPCSPCVGFAVSILACSLHCMLHAAWLAAAAAPPPPPRLREVAARLRLWAKADA